MNSQAVASQPPQPADPERQETLSLKSFRSWQELFIYFWVFSLAGHYLEVFWAVIIHWVTGAPLWTPSTPTVIPLAPPYGLGVVAIVIAVWPLMKRHKINPLFVFILSVLITSFVEYVCAAILVLVLGHNPFWDYSGRFLSINGYVSLRNSLLFGAASIIFLYYILPFCEKVMSQIKRVQINRIFWFLLITYCLDLLYTWLVVW